MIGITSEFTTQKKLRKLPSDIWEVEIDSATINPPVGWTVSELPTFPDPDDKILRYHLKQVNSILGKKSLKLYFTNILESLYAFFIVLGIRQYCNSANKKL